MHFQIWQYVVTAILQLHRKEVIMDSCVIISPCEQECFPALY